jgi:hypothetical protein
VDGESFDVENNTLHLPRTRTGTHFMNRSVPATVQRSADAPCRRFLIVGYLTSCEEAFLRQYD